MSRYSLTIADTIQNPHHVGPDEYYQRGISDKQIDAVCLDMHKRGRPISVNKVIAEIDLLIRTGVADFDCGARKESIVQRLGALRSAGKLPEAEIGRPSAKPVQAVETLQAMPMPTLEPVPIATPEVAQEPFIPFIPFTSISAIEITGFDWHDKFIEEEQERTRQETERAAPALQTAAVWTVKNPTTSQIVAVLTDGSLATEKSHCQTVKPYSLIFATAQPVKNSVWQ